MKKAILILMIILSVLNITLNAHADWRKYVWTYEYMTMRKGSFELETYLTTEVPNLNKSNVNTFKPLVELEYGITDRWDIAMYQQFKVSNKKEETDTEYDGFKLRTRYRIGEKNQFILDPLLYLEYIREEELSKPNILEAKLVLAKDIGRYNISYNQIVKQELDNRGETENEYAFGAGYSFSNRLKLDLESKGNYTKEKYYLGPSVSFASRKFWAAFGILRGMNNRSDDLQTRLIIGIPF